MAFFSKNATQLAPLAFNGKAQYRECQIGAAWATLAHFTSSSEPALISLPTGSGKTALMMMLSFLLKAERVIIITPGVALRGQTSEKFGSLSDLRGINAIDKSCPNPRVLDHSGQLRNPQDWQNFLNYDVVIATPHSTSPGYDDIVGPPPNTFDSNTVLFLDEAHHSRARTWQILMETFADCIVVLLTATPFRNDNRRLLAKLVYHYPMKRALESKIYAPITYHGVDPSNPKEKDQELCRKAIDVLKRHRKKHKKARLLIRAEGVTKSGELLKLYRNENLEVEEVNYKKTFDENRATLNDLRKGRLDGVVCVDQIGEGLDVPSLKIAVLHKPRQSFPATVQFIGRICREAQQDIGQPHLIACADDVKGPLQKLYLHDNAWREFVPELVEKVIGSINRKSTFHSLVDVESELDLSPEDIQPFFSARVYRNSISEPLKLDGILDIREDVVPVYYDIVTDKNMLVVITGIEKTLPWAEKADLSTPHFDLHVYYWHEKAERLFEYTTSDKIAGMIRRSLWRRHLPQRINAAEITKALQETNKSQYLMFGLSSLSHSSGSIPSYKTYMGKEVEGAVHPTDSRSFTPGHALAKYSSGETRGIGSNKARVWSIHRATLGEFKHWCDQIAKCLIKRGDSRLPNVEFLSTPESISEFPCKPLAAYVRWEPTLRITLNSNGIDTAVGEISLERLSLSKDRKAITGEVALTCDDVIEKSSFTYSLAVPRWTFNRSNLPSLKIDDMKEIHSSSLSDFLDAHLPIIVMNDGSTVIGSSQFKPKLSLPSLPRESFDCRDWSECDTHVEFEYCDPSNSSRDRKPKPGKLSVHDQLDKWLLENTSIDTVVIKDHATGEIADFVEINQDVKLIRFYHCKACSLNKKPGARISELNVIEQVLRSVDRIGTNSLLAELHRRVNSSDRPNTKTIKGTAHNLAKVVSTFHANQWHFEIAIVNPGIDCNKARKRKNTNTLLTACYEWLASANAKLLVIGS